MPATLRRLLGDSTLGLRLLTPEVELPSGVLGTAVTWVHSSDLDDPTPFLLEGHVLLTTGTQFRDDVPETRTAAYVRRLITRGVAGLGFGTDVVRAGTPGDLVAECSRQGLPLFEVPYRTPFIAIARHAADIIADEAHARHAWALRAQAAVSLAATRADGLSAALAELARQLGGGVALWSSRGALEGVFGGSGGVEGDATVLAEVERMLRAGRRASATVDSSAGLVTLQSFGTSARLRGVLGVATAAPLDRAAQQVVTSVVGLAVLALDQQHAHDRALDRLRSGLVPLLRHGDVDLVDAVLESMGESLPAAPFRVAIARVDGRGPLPLLAELDLLAADVRTTEGGGLFFAEEDGHVVALLPPVALDRLERVVSTLGVRFGLSDPSDTAGLAAAMRQARHALDAAPETAPAIASFASLAARGVLSSLGDGAAAEIAGVVLAPLIAHDRTNSTELFESGWRWLAANGEFEAAARDLGVHRHTLRSRVTLIERVLGRDLSGFAARAELWSAYVALGHVDP